MADQETQQAFQARHIFPVNLPPIADGFLTIRGGTIVDVGVARPDCPVLDLGNVVILPGLVNAHTHLEFSDLEAPIGRPGMPLPDWIRQVIAHRRAAADSGHSAVAAGINESLAGGTTALGEIATTDWRSHRDLTSALKTGVTMFHEAIAPKEDRIAGTIESAEQFLLREEPCASIRPALSPHAPYTVHPELLAKLVELSRRFQVPLAMHLAESPEEIELLRSGSGPFRQLLEDLQSWDPRAEARYPRVLDYLEQLAQAPRALVIHGNFLDATELDFLAARHETMGVVYCPRTHHYFGHSPYPLQRMLAMKINMALGTDSRASNPDLSLFAEMRFAADSHPQIPRSTVVELATLGGASVLGIAPLAGTLEPGKRADFVVIETPPQEADDPHDLLFAPTARVAGTWIAGTSECRSEN